MWFVFKFVVCIDAEDTSYYYTVFKLLYALYIPDGIIANLIITIWVEHQLYQRKECI